MKKIGSSIFPLAGETLVGNLPGMEGEGQPHGVLGMEEEDGLEGGVVVVELEFYLVDVVLEVVGEHTLQHLFLLFGRELGVVQQLLEHPQKDINYTPTTHPPKNYSLHHIQEQPQICSF